MPHESLVREKLAGSVLIARLAVLFFVACVGGGVVGAVAALAGGWHAVLFWNSAPDSFGELIGSAVIVVSYGLAFGCVLGGISSPILMLAIVRKPLETAAFKIYKACALLALSIFVYPPAGAIIVIATFLIACFYRWRKDPVVWPAVIQPGRCVGCGYDLAGITSDHCPECGRQRPTPRQCRVCLQPIPFIALQRQTPAVFVVVCKFCHHELGSDMVCQRCGHTLSSDSHACPDCRHSTDLHSQP